MDVIRLIPLLIADALKNSCGPDAKPTIHLQCEPARVGFVKFEQPPQAAARFASVLSNNFHTGKRNGDKNDRITKE
jgi:hypothetical protein